MSGGCDDAAMTQHCLPLSQDSSDERILHAGHAVGCCGGAEELAHDLCAVPNGDQLWGGPPPVRIRLEGAAAHAVPLRDGVPGMATLPQPFTADAWPLVQGKCIVQECRGARLL